MRRIIHKAAENTIGLWCVTKDHSGPFTMEGEKLPTLCKCNNPKDDGVTLRGNWGVSMGVYR